MRELILIAQTSLDGFVAGIHGEFDHFIGGEENLEFVCSIIDEADAALLGRISYQLLNNDWPTAANKPGATKNMIKYSNWYNVVSKFVVSKTLQQQTTGNATIINEDLLAAINKLKQEPGKKYFNIWKPYPCSFIIRIKHAGWFLADCSPGAFRPGHSPV